MCRFARAVTEFNFEVLQDVSALTQKTLLLTANGESHVFDPYWGCPLGAGPGSFHMTHCRHVVKVRVWLV